MRFLLSWLYGLITFLRNLLYDEHILPSYSPRIPTICVGNLAVGGTGKTPHVEYIVRLLLREGYRVAILSRGYKRRTSGFVLADASSTADTLGDEPRQYHLKFPELTVAVCEDRTTGIKRLLSLHPDLDVIVFDDAFQHRKVRCGFNILLTPSDALYVHDHLLPRGRLRESSRGASRADMVVVTKCPPTMLPIQRRVITTALHCPTFQDLCFSSIHYASPLPIFPAAENNHPSSSPSASLEAPSAENNYQLSIIHYQFFLLTAIAQPQYLADHLGDRVVGSLSFPDHHRFTARDIQRLLTALAPFGPNVIVLTTEKDAARLRDSSLIPASLKPRLFYLPITIDLGPDAPLFEQKLLHYLREHRRLSLPTTPF